jgi:flagellar biosynthesis/type III secretory pathway chaperone
MAPSTTPTRPAAAPPIASSAEAARLIGHLAEVMTSLLAVLEEETQLVRAGRISEVARIEPQKSELARLYVADAGLVRGNALYLARELPREFEDLRRRHEHFRALLQINLAVLATAHAVSEGIIRGAAGELARKAAPQTYGLTGRATAPAASACPPVAVSRRL